MADFKKILEHPENQTVIDKLLMGGTPKEVCEYLGAKFSKPDEKHLRLSESLLKEFKKQYCDTGKFLDKIVKDEKSGALDKQITQSLLNTTSWKERVAELADDKIDLERKIIEQMSMLEQRQEQIYDKIQQNPENVKLDYVMTKYFELSAMLIERADKVINKAPDQRIEHTYTVKMVEEQSVILQEAIRRVISRLDPHLASTFMDMLSEEMSDLKSPNDVAPVTINAANKELSKIDAKVKVLDAKFEDV